MTAEVTREEFTALEREVEGEKLVTRHILEQEPAAMATIWRRSNPGSIDRAES